MTAMSTGSPVAQATKTAIITGSNRGIGRGIAIRLARAGMQIALVARDQALSSEVKREIEEAGGKALVISVDLRRPEAAQQVVDETVRVFSAIDILVNNAGATKRGAFLELSDADWQDGYALKLFGATRLSRTAWPYLKQNYGSVVNIGGVGGRAPGPDFSIGGSVNAALMAFTKSLADLGVRDGVQVNLINPGAVRTERLQKRIAAFAHAEGLDLSTAAERLIHEMDTTRFGEATDVANLVAFIVSAEGRWLQGSLIDIDGGQTKAL